MQAPKRKKSKSARNMRRSHDGLTRVSAAKCKNCGEIILPHAVCTACGHYRGRTLLNVA